MLLSKRKHPVEGSFKTSWHLRQGRFEQDLPLTTPLDKY